MFAWLLATADGAAAGSAPGRPSADAGAMIGTRAPACSARAAYPRDAAWRRHRRSAPYAAGGALLPGRGCTGVRPRRSSRSSDAGDQLLKSETTPSRMTAPPSGAAEPRGIDLNGFLRTSTSGDHFSLGLTRCPRPGRRHHTSATDVPGDRSGAVHAVAALMLMIEIFLLETWYTSTARRQHSLPDTSRRCWLVSAPAPMPTTCWPCCSA